MMATTARQLAIDAFDRLRHAGGIAEMSDLPKEVRERTDCSNPWETPRQPSAKVSTSLGRPAALGRSRLRGFTDRRHHIFKATYWPLVYRRMITGFPPWIKAWAGTRWRWGRSAPPVRKFRVDGGTGKAEYGKWGYYTKGLARNDAAGPYHDHYTVGGF